jgi:hypothetical protein
MQEYDIGFEVTRVFLADLLLVPYLACFEVLGDHFKNDLSKYEVKIALLQRLKPFMKKQQAEKIMKTFEEVLSEPAENSIFRQNINPLRVGLTLYKLIDDIQNEFGYSQYTSIYMKNKIESQVKSIIDVYKDPAEIIKLMENQDIDGHNCFFYMQKYSLYNILDSKIMDKFIYDKWTGRIEFNATLLDYSTPYNLLNDQHKLYQSDKLLDQLYQKLFDYNKQEKTHEYKFHVWKKSMALRYGIEFCFVLLMTLYFQIEIGKFNRFLHISKHEV